MTNDERKTLEQLRENLNEVQEDDGGVMDNISRVGQRVGRFIEGLEERREDLAKELVEELLELENAVKERYPRLAESIRSAVNIMSNAGI